MNELPYHEQRDQKNEAKLQELLTALPPFCADFFRGIEPATSSMTRLSYAYDISMFFDFLISGRAKEASSLCIEAKPENRFAGLSAKDFTMEQFRRISVTDLERYLEYWKYRPDDPDHRNTNKEQGIKRKFFSLKSFFGYFQRTGQITANPTLSMQVPKIREKEIIRLNQEEIKELLKEAESGAGLSPKQQQFHQKTRVRDCAILALMLGTGIRVSECVGLNLSDVNLKEQGIHIHRKGGKEATVYFSNEVAQYLERYLEERMELHTKANHTEELNPQEEPALFLSLRRKRLTVRSVEYLVKKYASVATPKKKITPHKLRSSYGSALYAKTNDIYLVADILGHNDVNITRKFYAAIEEERRKSVKHIDLL